MTADFLKLTHESWENIYAIYFETRTEPTTWPTEGILSSIHHMMYLKPNEIMPPEDA